jgi:hypothetical protein
MLVDNAWIECLDCGMYKDPTSGLLLFVIMECASGHKHYLTEDEVLEKVVYGN